jgi:hypothetical protein
MKKIDIAGDWIDGNLIPPNSRELKTNAIGVTA